VTDSDDAQARFAADVDDLVSRDEDLAGIVLEYGVPTFWHRPPGFPALALLILEQQVSLASAAACFCNLRDLIGGVTPDAVLRSTPEETRSAGVSRQKDRYLRALAEAVSSRALDLAGLETLSDDEARAALTALPGIGRWTADTYLLSCLQRPDIWPVGDRALQVAVGETLGTPTVPTPAELDDLGQRWIPRRSNAARLLWHGYLTRRGRVETPNDILQG